jgi:predicted secreted hydrolase
MIDVPRALVLLASAVATATLVAQGAQAPAWKDASPGRAIVLPADHASHPDYKVEWWYYTGNLDSTDSRRFGYQLTFFRVGIDSAPSNPSRWAVRDLFMAHFALTDANGQQFRFVDRINRSGPGWAGAATDMYRVWNEEWQASRDSGSAHHLVASTKEFGIDLRLDELGGGRRAVLHGDRGYSRKGSTSGNASFYYSLTRMPTHGTVTVGGRAIKVSGLSWMDHEFGTTFLEKEQVGWDWFSLQLDDGRDLMVFQLRRRDGSIDPQSSGTLVEPDRSYRHVALDGGFALEPGRAWTSPGSGGRYPVEWRVRLPRESIDLSVRAVLDDQELRTGLSTGVNYWEGAIDVKGSAKGRPVQGRGYLEMTGYAGRGLDALR